MSGPHLSLFLRGYTGAWCRAITRGLRLNLRIRERIAQGDLEFRPTPLDERKGRGIRNLVV